MKHPSNREFFAYWDRVRADEAAPDRSSLAPEAVRHLLGDIFVLSYEPEGYPFRVAGTRICALLGGDMKGRDFTSLFSGDSCREIKDILGIVAEETLATVAGVNAATASGEIAHLELLLLPFSNRAHTPLSLTGLLAPFEQHRGRMLPGLTLTSWRHIGHERRRGPRAVRKWTIVRGLTVYEGLR